MKELTIETSVNEYGSHSERREALVIGVPSIRRGGALSRRLNDLDQAAGGPIRSLFDSGDFEGRIKQTVMIRPGRGQGGPERILLTGLGKPEDYDAETMRLSLAAALKALAPLNLETASVDLLSFASDGIDQTRSAELASETAHLALWRNLNYRSRIEDDEKRTISGIELLWSGSSGLDDAVRAAERSAVISRGTLFARHLVSAPPNELYPQTFAEEAGKVAGHHGFAISVLDQEELARLGMNALVSVGLGSARPPCMMIIDSRPDSDEQPLAIVGKGITFDTGGISIKPSKGMDEMKGDMAGGAAVLAAMDVLGGIGFDRRVVAVIPAAENMLGASAQRPGDIVKAYNGITVEVLNTDAEGRLVLADALSYCVEKFRPSHIIDMATLTGACVVALGQIASGLFCNDDALGESITRAGAETFERVWKLPMFPEYNELIKSDIADIKNTGGRWAGAITAAAFLQKFVSETPWAHLDIAGPSWLPKATGYLPKGPTGVGVRLLVELLTRQLAR